MNNINYKYCGKSNIDRENSFEHLIAQVVGSEYEYVQSCNKSCNNCRRDDRARYCGKGSQIIGIYTGDHYDDVIDAIIKYLEENE